MGDGTVLHALWECALIHKVWKELENYSILKGKCYDSFAGLCCWVISSLSDVQWVRFAYVVWSL